ncbi:hypothetical protein ACWT_0827 [Actinoplanes sp. SE50]|uniref:hypothetical protein n=1 Tax=unclassified Actinoplanes TaxID=2626549 RepID=UPI00023EC03B|nr:MULTISPECIES: hypothetical protein [unclassified Actinoplanes]AEV81841.1 hypothetical protein ACPL_944 [Actinoplanes sp. SE50/110]ATO80242.1 hypothetical protein ACWT_0827 [Actinoplanes sp. SE50]SLL97647.1 hypothetical protein ACSP50_0854 [Actinoplanes sp. SE50/110]
MLTGLLRRISRIPGMVRRATVIPMLVRAGIALCGLFAIAVAWPIELVASQFVVPLVLVALWPAFAPRGRAATFAALVVVAGWIVDTSGYDSRIALWRVLSLATLLYLGHTLTALAAVLPYDAVVNLEVPGLWLGRAGIVVLISAVLTVLALGLTADLDGDAFQLATLVGLAAATGVTMLLVRLTRRS